MRTVVAIWNLKWVPIFIVLPLSICLGQGKINQTTPSGLKTGKWVSFHLSGDTASISNYRTAKVKMTPSQLFESGLPMNDSIIESEIRCGTWTYFYEDNLKHKEVVYSEEGFEEFEDVYEYNTDRTVKLITRDPRRRPTQYLFPTKGGTLALTKYKFHLTERSYAPAQITSWVMNLTQQPVELVVNPNRVLSVPENSYSINPGDSLNLSISMVLNPGRLNEIISLTADGSQINLEVSGFSFHMNSKDFESGDPATMPQLFYYLKTGQEYQLEIAEEKKPGEPLTIPISQQISPIQLKPGVYELILIEPTRRLRKIVTVQ